MQINSAKRGGGAAAHGGSYLAGGLPTATQSTQTDRAKAHASGGFCTYKQLNARDTIFGSSGTPSTSQVVYPTTQTASNDFLRDERDPEVRHTFMAQLHKFATRGGAVRGSSINTDTAEGVHLRAVEERLARAAVNYANPNATSAMANGSEHLNMHSHALTGNIPGPDHFIPGIKTGVWGNV